MTAYNLADFQTTGLNTKDADLASSPVPCYCKGINKDHTQTGAITKSLTGALKRALPSPAASAQQHAVVQLSIFKRGLWTHALPSAFAGQDCRACSSMLEASASLGVILLQLGDW